MKKSLLITLKLIVTVLIFRWVIHKMGPNGLQDLWDHIRSAHPLGLILAFALSLFTLWLSIYRWKCLLRVQDIHLSHYHATWITAAGIFFNAFLMGATGGDVLKAWYAAEAAPKQKLRAVLSVVVDRIIGFAALFFLATIFVLINLKALWGDEKMHPVIFSTFGLFVGFITVMGLSTQHHRITSQFWWKHIRRFIPAKHLLSQLSESYHIYGKYPRVLSIIFLLSLSIHIGTVFTAWLIGMAIDIHGIQLRHYLIYCPIINIFSSIPITVGGLGIREQAFKFFFSMRGIPQAQSIALSLLFYAVNLAISLASGVLFLMGKPKSLSVISMSEISSPRP